MAEININTKYNKQIASPNFRANKNVTKHTETDEKMGVSNGAKWLIGLGLTALASYGIYYALTKGRVKAPKPTPKPENPIPEIKEMAIDAFKRGKDATKEGVNRLVKGKAILADGTKYTGNITSTGKDGSKLVMEYVDGVLQKSTKTAKDGTKIFDKAYTWAEDGLIKEIKKNGETILDENKLIEIYKKANTELIRKDSLEGRFPNVIKNLEEIYAEVNKIDDVDFKNNVEEFIKPILKVCGYVLSESNKIIKTGNPTEIIKEGLIELRTQNKNLQIELNRPFEKKYKDIIHFLQKMNKYVDDLKINKQTNELSKKIIKTVEDLGYKFKDFNPKNYDGLYEVELGKVDKVELVRRAIVDKNGNTIAEGKVYVPMNFM